MHAAWRGGAVPADAPATGGAPAALLGVDRAHVSPLWFLLVLVFLACLPDAMLPPVLQGLLVQRYGITPTAAHWFMTVNLIGALAAVPVLVVVRRRLPPALVLAVGAAANAALLLALAAPIGFGWSVGVRLAEGVADMVVLAVLFDLLSRGGPRAWRGHRLGLGGTALMLGLAVGAVAGGRLGRDAPLAVLPAGAAACGVLGLLSVFGWRLLRRSDSAQAPAPETDHRANALAPLWPSLAMFGADRALAGLLSTTV
ncbi:MAG: MFS transporter, partial [Phycisphaerales bacterium]|nr:MFS transporter [Phycisphaerales bacterium]